VTSSLTHGGRRYLPYVFTEQGVIMFSVVLKNEIAIKVKYSNYKCFCRDEKD